MDKRLADCEERMTKGLESFRRELASIRAGKATPALLDNIRVDYYGTPTPLKQVASVSAPEARLLVVQPWDKTLLTPIARAIQTSDLGLNPQDDGQLIKIPIPPLNEERRKDLVKMAHKLAEEGRVAVRNARRDVNEQIKKAQKDGQLPEDDAHRQTEAVQKLHDKFIAQIEEILKKKEAEVMEV
ncbi:MAG TPA: ribosome recycling factor [Dongiaceae bacterium]|jgi:ribosome recycling factor|nr:ribosome recycling factor [Dongiaceae bacterium]